MSRRLYSHPDGFSLDFAYGALVASDDDGAVVRLPIGLLGLAELAAGLATMALEGDDLAHEEGADLARDCLAAMQGVDSASRAGVMERALFCLQHNTMHPEVAIGGFAKVLVQNFGPGAQQ